ncbi:hypothetical protein CWB63_06960 [Pseudoalteromonas sp. S409]|nr:hypothetical protein CWB64_01015 [Pseudoalteromonas sp. S410]TMN93058.1 hypothetical protein CWB62_00615 [Pseudoalteromonas sp. S408]TMN99550.1 hypothetical protein CWB61_03615 [Pseudoalteromonas sp. S407]TMO00326.1 hypothetical protein CWB63_06960 [Pseudoalteromonas sp. S409]TMO12740.1 hypothetical protein CWB57_01910 [Pseudoalteromonas sp. S186]TMO18001.1 hypothetical protein CWB56_01630 [Pseudoalteromonas sp. S185]
MKISLWGELKSSAIKLLIKFKAALSIGSVDLLGGYLRFVAYMDVGKRHEQDAKASLSFYLFLYGCKPVE